MKRLLSLALAAVCFLLFCACAPASLPGDTTGTGTGQTPATTTGAPKPPADPTDTTPRLTMTADVSYCVVGTRLTFTLTGEHCDPATAEIRVSEEGMLSGETMEGNTYRARAVRPGTLTVSAACEGASADCTVTVFAQENTYAANDARISYVGRYEEKGNATLLANTAAGISVRFYGRKLTAKLKNESGNAIFAVLADGKTDPEETKINLATDGKNGTYTLAEFDREGVHTVRLLKVTEESISRATLLSLTVERGGLLPAEDSYAFRLHVYGDSITCGYGNLRAEGDPDVLQPETQNGLLSYAGLTATELGAYYSAFAKSGIGLYTDPYNGTVFAGTAYDRVSPGSRTAWDLTKDAPDVVVINLGTNDIWHSAEKENDRNPVFSEADYRAAYLSFVRNLAAVYGKDVHFFLCSGMMETGLAKSVAAVADILSAEGISVTAVVLPLKTGYGGHPCLAAHRDAAEVLTEAICIKLGIH